MSILSSLIKTPRIRCPRCGHKALFNRRYYIRCSICNYYKIKCELCPHLSFNITGFQGIGYCLKLDHPIENGFAMLYHSALCGEGWEYSRGFSFRSRIGEI